MPRLLNGNCILYSFMKGSVVTLTDCSLNNNSARKGGAMELFAIDNKVTTVTLNRCTINFNTATPDPDSNKGGGAIFMNRYSDSVNILHIYSSELEGNYAFSCGDVLWCDSETYDVSLYDTAIAESDVYGCPLDVIPTSTTPHTTTTTRRPGMFPDKVDSRRNQKAFYFYCKNIFWCVRPSP